MSIYCGLVWAFPNFFFFNFFPLSFYAKAAVGSTHGDAAEGRQSFGNGPSAPAPGS